MQGQVQMARLQPPAKKRQEPTLACGGVACFLWLADIRLNFLNFAALPITFGIGVDYAVNVAQRYRADRRKDILRVLRTFGFFDFNSFSTRSYNTRQTRSPDKQLALRRTRLVEDRPGWR